MKSIPLGLALVLAFSPAAEAQDLDKGAAAYSRGDYAMAMREWRPLAERGNVEAQFAVGNLYAEGLGVPEDDAKAMRWFRKGVDQGNAHAQYLLAIVYQNGNGIPQDDAEAVKWCHKAAEQGYADAQGNLGYRYAFGRGVPQDYREAYIWYNLSVAGGNAYNRQFRDWAAEKLTPDQLLSAQREARKRWRRIKARKK